MTETANSGSGRSSLLYAMGRLEAVNQQQSEEIKALPERVAAMFLPRVLALETASGNHEVRLKALERWKWTLAGGGAVILTIATLATETGLIHFPVK
jgi:hypothetical protein